MKKWLFILLTLLSVYGVIDSKATHVIGTDITWTCIGQDSFLIKLVVYRDCNGIVLSAAPITFSCQKSGATITNLTIPVTTPVDVTPVCSSSCSRCQSTTCSFPFGIHKYSMTGIVKLSTAGSCCGIYLSWEQCCRNGAITTGAGNQNYYTEALLNRCQNPCDNSPIFTNLPASILCYGQDFISSSGGYDMDVDSNGKPIDSLRYEWAEPLSGKNSTIPYIGSYAYNKPFNFLGFPNDTLPFPAGIHLDSLSGEIRFRPTISEISVMTVRINEYRNGKLIAQVRRDMQVAVISCPANIAPTLSTQNNIRKIRICPGDSVTFNFTTYDSNSNDTVMLYWNRAVPGAIWTHNNGSVKHSNASLKWLPSAAHSSKLPYIFTVTAKDNTCPVNSEITQTYQIIVHSPIIDMKPAIRACIRGSIINLDNYVTVDGVFKTGGIWSCPGSGFVSPNKFNPAVAGISSPPGWKIYYEYTDTGGCYSKDSAFITVYDSPAVDAQTLSGEKVFCRTAGLIPLKGQPAGGIWSGPGITGDKFNTAIGANVPSEYQLKYTYTDTGTCSNSAEIKIKVIPEPVLMIDPSGSILCAGVPNTIKASYAHADGVYWWKGPGSDGDIIGSPFSATISYNPGYNDVMRLYFWLFVKTTSNDTFCAPAYDSIMVSISATPLVDFSASPLTGSAPLTVQFTDLSTISKGKICAWEWYFGDGGISGDTNPVHTYTTPAKHDVKLKVISDAGCENDTTKAGYIANAIEPKSNTNQFRLYPNPAHGELFIENPENVSINFMISDIYGKVLLEKKIIKGKNTINLLTIKSGIYFIFLDGKSASKLLVE